MSVSSTEPEFSAQPDSRIELTTAMERDMFWPTFGHVTQKPKSEQSTLVVWIKGSLQICKKFTVQWQTPEGDRRVQRLKDCGGNNENVQTGFE